VCIGVDVDVNVDTEELNVRTEGQGEITDSPSFRLKETRWTVRVVH